MISLTSVVVDVDVDAADHPAVDQARHLAARCGARLKIVDVLPPVPASARHFVTDTLERELVEHRTERLQALAQRVGGGATSQLLRGRPSTALIEEVLAGGHDLLVRAHERDLDDPPRRYGAIDMELLRHCPRPVWLIGRRRSHHSPFRIVAAINATADDDTERQLNAIVLDWALMLREALGARVTLLHAWSVFGATMLQSRLAPHEFAGMIEDARREADWAMAAFTAPYGERLRDADVQLVEGEPERAISEYVEQHGVDLVVMGTVARSGIPGLVMGNTAERVLQRLRGSVFAVKPAGFVSPLEQARTRG